MADLIARIRAAIDERDWGPVCSDDGTWEASPGWPFADAHRQILDLHVIYDVSAPNDFWKNGAHLCEVCSRMQEGELVHDDGPACRTVLLIAKCYQIEVGR